MNQTYKNMASVQFDLVTEKLPLIFLTGKTSCGKTYLSGELEKSGYNVIKLDDIIFKSIMPTFGITESNLGFKTYRGNVPPEWLTVFVQEARKRIEANLENGPTVIEGALAHIETIKKIFSDKFQNFLFLFLLPADVTTYVERITKRFVLGIETKSTGLPKEFFRLVEPNRVQKYLETKSIDPETAQKIKEFAQWSLEESERRLSYFRTGFDKITVVNV